MKGKLEETLWDAVNDVGNGSTKLIGGDFNMSCGQVDKELGKKGSEVKRIGLQGQECTFRRLDSVNGKLHKTTIDHVLVRGKGNYGSKVSDSGLDANDHDIVMGWVEVEDKGKKRRPRRLQ